MPNISVPEIRKCEKPGNLKAFADVQIDDILIKDFRIIQQKDQKAWVSVPQSCWRDSSGSLAYRNLVEIPKDLKADIEYAVLASYNESAMEVNNCYGYPKDKSF